MSQKLTDTVKQIVTALSTLMLFLGTVGVRFDWFTLDSIEAFGVFLGAFLLLLLSLYGIWMNTYSRWKSFRLAEEKKQRRLAEEAGKTK